MNIQNLIGKKLDAYNDGKLSPSRLLIVTIEAVLPLTEIKEKYFKAWKREINRDMIIIKVHLDNNWKSMRDDVFTDVYEHQMFDWNCKKFIFGTFKANGKKKAIMFAKMKNGGWYGVNYNYLLDTTGKIRKNNMKNWQICAKENGWELKVNKETNRLEYYDISTGKFVGFCG